MKDRPYGHGYLAAAYIGYLAAGGTGPVTSRTIARGMDAVFADLINGRSLYDTLNAKTGGKIKDASSLEETAVCRQCRNIMAVPVLRLIETDQAYVGRCPDCGRETEILEEDSPITCPNCGAGEVEMQEIGRWD